MTKGPSQHLTWKELACKDGTVYPLGWRDSRAAILAQEFEKIRALVGGPIRIGSAYRTPEHNRKIGGAQHSQHVEGRALDLYPPETLSVVEFGNIIKSYAAYKESKIYGLGFYPTFIHIDVRPKPEHGRLIVWQGSRAWAELKKAGG